MVAWFVAVVGLGGVALVLLGAVHATVRGVLGRRSHGRDVAPRTPAGPAHEVRVHLKDVTGTGRPACGAYEFATLVTLTPRLVTCPECLKRLGESDLR